MKTKECGPRRASTFATLAEDRAPDMRCLSDFALVTGSGVWCRLVGPGRQRLQSRSA